MRLWLLLAGLFGALGVLAGAYGWHGVGGDEGARLMFEFGSTYQMFHALALLAVAWLASIRRGPAAVPVHVAGVCFSLGMLLFSGTLYSLIMLGSIPFEGAAPIGGILLIFGWLSLSAAAVMPRFGAKDQLLDVSAGER